MFKKASIIGVSLIALSGSVMAAENKLNELNPQPEPPGVTKADDIAHNPTWSASSDSGSETQRKLLNPQPEPPGVTGDSSHKATFSAGSDSGSDKKIHGATWAAGSDSSEDKAKKVQLNPQPEPPGVQRKSEEHHTHPSRGDNGADGKGESTAPPDNAGDDDAGIDSTTGVGTGVGEVGGAEVGSGR